MNTSGLWHQAKSAYSYAYDDNTLHLVMRAARNDLKDVTLVYGDPFDWTVGPDGNARWAHRMETMEKRYSNDTFDWWFVAVNPVNDRTKYAFLCDDGTHRFLFGSKRARRLEEGDALYGNYDLSEFYNYPYLNREDLHHTPAWVKDTIWYQIFPDRFHASKTSPDLPWGKLPVRNHELYGGDLKGIMDKLPYLKDLGVNGIYFTPIFMAPSAHKYDTTDYFRIDPQFGTNDDFGDLVKAAHSLGIKVMLDGVFNHAGFSHPFFQDVVRNGAQSKYADCFFIGHHPVLNFPLDDDGLPVSYHGIPLRFKAFGFTPHMPKWNTANPLARDHLLSAIRYWIETYDIDGWRLDVANEISHEFLREIRRVAREAKADTFILGENWDSAIPWLLGDQMDSVMNYDLSYPLWSYLEHKIPLDTFRNMTVNYMASTPKNVMENMFNLVGSHDTVRIRRRLEDDPSRVKLAYLFMFLSAGAPNIYYGDETGMTGDHDPDNRRCMDFDTTTWDTDFHAFVKALIRMRKAHPAASAHDYVFIESPVLSFEKQTGDDHLVVFMNNSPETTVTDIPVRFQKGHIDALTGQKVTIGDTMTLEPYGYLVLSKEETS
jgi:cyclomaltodextrinase / maltogenic alpha-amylase / neopullulanase